MSFRNACLPALASMRNAVSTAGRFGIPTVVLGPGSIETAHMRDEYCPVNDIVNACKAYAHLIYSFSCGEYGTEGGS